MKRKVKDDRGCDDGFHIIKIADPEKEAKKFFRTGKKYQSRAGTYKVTHQDRSGFMKIRYESWNQDYCDRYPDFKQVKNKKVTDGFTHMKRIHNNIKREAKYNE